MKLPGETVVPLLAAAVATGAEAAVGEEGSGATTARADHHAVTRGAHLGRATATSAADVAVRAGGITTVAAAVLTAFTGLRGLGPSRRRPRRCLRRSPRASRPA